MILKNNPFWFETEYTNQPSLPETIENPKKNFFINKKDVPVVPLEDYQMKIIWYDYDLWK